MADSLKQQDDSPTSPTGVKRIRARLPIKERIIKLDNKSTRSFTLSENRSFQHLSKNLKLTKLTSTESSTQDGGSLLVKKNQCSNILDNTSDHEHLKDELSQSKRNVKKKITITDDRKNWNHQRKLVKFFNTDLSKKSVEKIFPTAYLNEYSKQLADIENYDDSVMVKKLEELDRNKNNPVYFKSQKIHYENLEKVRRSKKSNFLNRTNPNKNMDNSYFVIKRNTSNSDLNSDLNYLDESGDASVISYTEEKLTKLYEEARDIQGRIYEKKKDHLSRRMKQLIKLKTITE